MLKFPLYITFMFERGQVNCEIIILLSIFKEKFAKKKKNIIFLFLKFIFKFRNFLNHEKTKEKE